MMMTAEEKKLQEEEDRRMMEAAMRQRQLQQQKAAQNAMNIPYAKEALAMYGLVEAGNELGIGAQDQMDEYKRFGKKIDDEVIDKLKFWEWF